ncbi:hypothetical protein [Trichormus sp. NMC-1]|uniref:hypothetical protein n=1 Tax=Trichormus sp. NMC-1 TaxID=1853259 RepID=UPI00115FB31D|nr:hypothetical protein [Trichormus sp. NMC-1]
MSWEDVTDKVVDKVIEKGVEEGLGVKDFKTVKAVAETGNGRRSCGISCWSCLCWCKNYE